MSDSYTGLAGRPAVGYGGPRTYEAPSKNVLDALEAERSGYGGINTPTPYWIAVAQGKADGGELSG